ncbi:TIGR03086 family metal-binding protein [Streptomyces sp. NPDC018057]|uniref:TIGR03086 family metal-binding protein n=1 Tax=unclassified Streptomyces TaxID=2593676 RepID=UPI0037914808
MNTADPRAAYARATEQAAALIRAVRPEQLTDPTPCAEFDVRALLGHIVGGTLRIAVAGEGGDGLSVDPSAVVVADDDWSGAYEEARGRAVKAWEPEERLAAPVRVPWGEVPGRAALAGYVMELVAHTWDLNEAVGRPLELDPALSEAALDAARRMLPESGRGEGVPFADPRPVDEGADAHERLAAWLGRTPVSRA